MTISNSLVILEDSSNNIYQDIVDSFGSAEIFYEQLSLVICEKEVIINYITEIKTIMLTFEENKVYYYYSIIFLGRNSVWYH